MKTTKNMGIWMDHSIAHCMAMEHGEIELSTIHAKAGYHEVKDTIGLDESNVQNKEHDEVAKFFKRLGNVIKGYDAVILFGPTDARIELLNELKDNLHFSKIKIEEKSADKMTENQMKAFTKDYFEQ